MRVLSLFDGISCGMVALERAGIPVERYVAYEIEDDAIKVSKHNHPMIEQKGDVFKAEYKEGEFDLLIGGSPCTYWSIAKAGYGRETTSSGIGFELFMQYVRALREAKPKWFLYENNESMSDAIKKEITSQLGVEPILIDSADFSAQHRKRLYWTNIPFDMRWEKSDALFEDIMQHDVEHKARNFEKWKDTVKISKDGMNVRYDTSGKGHYGQGNRAKKPKQKWNTLPSAGSNTKNDIWVDDYISWHITPTEMERLQTLPDGYTSCLNSDIKSMRVCGNGWTVDVIAHIFTGLRNKEEEKEMELKVKTPTLPEVIEFNFDELKQEITEKASGYMSLVYTEEQVKDAKKDMAMLRKFTKALSDERIRIKKDILKPYTEFETKINELSGIVEKAIVKIDLQVKGFEEQKKNEKQEQIREYWDRVTSPEHPLTLQRVMNPKWLNATTSMKSIQEEINGILAKYAEDIATLQNLPEFGFEAVEVYKSSLDINKALNEAQRMAEIQKRKAEAEFAKHMNPPEDVPQVVVEAKEKRREWIGFKAFLTTEDALALKAFFESRNIQFESI